MGDFAVPGVHPDLFNIFMDNGIVPDFYAKSVLVAFMPLGTKAGGGNDKQQNRKDQDPQCAIHKYKGKTKNNKPYYRSFNFVSLSGTGKQAAYRKIRQGKNQKELNIWKPMRIQDSGS